MRARKQVGGVPVSLGRGLLGLGLLGLGASAQAEQVPLAAKEAPVLAPLWTAAAGGPDGGSVQGLVAAEDAALVITDAGAVQAHDAATGRLLWSRKAESGGGDGTSEVVVEGALAVVTLAGSAQVEGLDVRTGAARWTRLLSNLPVTFAGCAQHRVGVAVVRDQEAFAAQALDLATGEPLWRTPVEGELVGVGGDHVFLGVRSATGRLNSRVEAVHCATGERTTLPGGQRPFVSFVAASGRRAALRHFEYGFKNQQVCVYDLEGEGEARCFDPLVGGEREPLSGGAMVGELLLVAAHRSHAPNLDPRPSGWLRALNLSDFAFRWESAPQRSLGHVLDAGGQLLTGYGGTGAADFLYLLDPADGSTLASAALKKAPDHLAANARQAFVATYAGQVLAFALPRPGAKPPVRAVVKPGPNPSGTPRAAGLDLGWKVLATHSVHPERARTSGQDFPGTASPAAFLDAEGSRLVVGGNDDKVRVVEVATGRAAWTSAGLGKDVEEVHVCAGERFVARIYGGRAFAFGPAGKKFKQNKVFNAGHGWASGLTAGCEHYLASDFDGNFKLWNLTTGQSAGAFAAPTVFDGRGVQVRGARLVASGGPGLKVFDVGPRAEGPDPVGAVATPAQAHGGALTQAWMVDDDRLLREYCGPASCTVEVVTLDGGKVLHTQVFDTRAAGWSATVPSAIDVDRAGQWLFFYRRSLPAMLVDLEGNRRQRLTEVVGAGPDELTEGRFSADGRRLVLASYPRTWQVTVLTR